MDPGFPDRGTQAQMDEYLRGRKAKGLLNASAAIARLHQVANTKPNLQSQSKSCFDRLTASTDKQSDHATIAKLTTEVKRLQDIIDRAKAESELVQSKGRAMVAVPYWFIKA
jgi:hypothetical protein